MKIILLTLLSLNSLLHAQAPRVAGQGTKTDITLAVHPGVAASAQNAVQKLGNEVRKGNFLYALETMYPRYRKIQEAKHGKKALKQQVADAAKDLNNMGITILKFTALKPSGYFQVWPSIKPGVQAKIDRGEQELVQPSDMIFNWLVIIPTVQEWKFSGKNGAKPRYLKRTEFQCAIAPVSPVPGKEKWTFIAPLKASDLRTLFPTLPQDLILPQMLNSEIDQNGNPVKKK